MCELCGSVCEVCVNVCELCKSVCELYVHCVMTNIETDESIESMVKDLVQEALSSETVFPRRSGSKQANPDEAKDV